MRITPAPSLKLTRPYVTEIGGKVYADGVEYTQNLVPTGKYQPLPTSMSKVLWQFDDAADTNTLTTLYKLFDRGFLFLESGGSFSLANKTMKGVVNTPWTGTGSFACPGGYLYTCDSRLPTSFTSVRGHTQGHKYVCTDRGIYDVAPNNVLTKATPSTVYPYWSNQNNSPYTSGDVAQAFTQQLLLGETETELFGITYHDRSHTISGVTSFNGNTGHYNASALFKTVKKVGGVLDNSAVLPGLTGGYELAYVGKYGTSHVFIRMQNTVDISNTSHLNPAGNGLRFRPVIVDSLTGEVKDTATWVTPPIGNQSVAGTMVRFAQQMRSVIETDTEIQVYIPKVLCTTDSISDGRCTGMQVHKFTYTKATKTWTDVLLTPTGGVYGDVMTQGTVGPTSLLYGGAMSLISSWFIDVAGEKHLVVLHTGTQVRVFALTHVENTIQYVYKLEANGSFTFVQKTVQPGVFGNSDAMYAYAASQDYRTLYVTGKSAVYRMVFDDMAMAYVKHLEYNVDAISLHVGVDETLTMIDADFNFYRLTPGAGSSVRLRFGDVPMFEGAPVQTQLFVSVLDNLGQRVSTSVKLELDGSALFDTNSQPSMTVTTSATEDLVLQVQITAPGEVFCTPTKP